MRTRVNDGEAQAREELEGQLLSALESKGRIEITPEYWEEKRMALLARHGEWKHAK